MIVLSLSGDSVIETAQDALPCARTNRSVTSDAAILSVFMEFISSRCVKGDPRAGESLVESGRRFLAPATKRRRQSELSRRCDQRITGVSRRGINANGCPCRASKYLLLRHWHDSVND